MAFDDEPATVAIMDKYLAANGYENDFSEQLFYNVSIKRKRQYLCRAESPDSPGNGP